MPDDKLAYDEKDFQKRVAPPQAKELLTKFRAMLRDRRALRSRPARRGAEKVRRSSKRIKIGDIVHTLRVAVTGKSVGPGVYDCLAILGRDSSLSRIDRALSQ